MRIISILIGAGSLFAQAPEIAFDSAPNLLKMPDRMYMGEAAGVATNSKGHIYVYTRTGDAYATTGTSRTFSHGGSRLFEFDQTGKYVGEIGQNSYGFLVAQSVRVDPQDNIWIVDKLSSLVVKFAPDGRVLMPMGRKPEAIFVGARGGVPGAGRGAVPAGAAGAAPGGGRGRGEGGPAPLPGAGAPGDLFNGPSDVAWDAQGNIFISDGFGNARIAKFDKNGKYLKSWGSRGSEPGQFNNPRSLATDAQGNIYVADKGNNRIQVFDNDGTFKTEIAGVGAPTAICISPGSHPYLYASNSNEVNSLDHGEIYKMELDGKVLGQFGRAGHLIKEFGAVNQIDCRRANELYVGELMNWRVQKITLH
ncbi:MAG TPA: peptidyl-alpha-hydroxyglycine alpha-amidating lyase family protein [Bryobacteraceae bacterium]|jgi:DNA-binding beta-propeller fold protein YncE|nr:peptidyl-alpha-hydroxyglycine alpha-amidating lyase family protein [Bryobacteraceae bacterium]